ncbi:MAG: hypothetical protein K9H48_21300 [Melioribacteraceae bacterium]|nr:hypothetical protein [Melioribacteraceae bacterium]
MDNQKEYEMLKKFALDLLDEDGISQENLDWWKSEYIHAYNNSSETGNKCLELSKEVYQLQEALKFYADPETYIAVGIFPDEPCGDFIHDFSETLYFGAKPGKLARETLSKLYEEHKPPPKDCEEELRKARIQRNIYRETIDNISKIVRETESNNRIKEKIEFEFLNCFKEIGKIQDSTD